ncbi:MAG: CoA transferase [Chloroflexi bacterium]|nr:CoA transferase [Chloroflexota bacterium]
MTTALNGGGRPPGALPGTLVVEWSAGRPGAYAGKLLRGLGAEVVLLEPPAGGRDAALGPGPIPTHDAELAARIRFLHGGKQSLTFDPADARSREIAGAVLARADILLLQRPLAEAEHAAMRPEDLAARWPNLIVVTMTLAGLRGEQRYWRQSDLVAHAIGGTAFATPARVPDPATYPPLKPGGYQADYTTGLTAANAALLGLQLRRRTGAGQLIDVSAQATLASYMRMDVAYRTYGMGDAMNISGLSRQSLTGRPSTIWGLVPCKDGYFAFQATEQYQWDGLMRMMGDPAWAKDSRFQDPVERAARWDEIEPHFVGWFADRTKRDIFHAGQAEHVPVFPCFNVEELVRDEQQVARAFFVDLPADDGARLIKVPGAVVHLERTPWQPSFDPPAPGEHTEALAQRFAAVGAP